MTGPALAPHEQAGQAQRQASDPLASAFVAASAGSGKTKVLTDRLLRLMLAGARPERIQCLTFTKAAAAEMALRLQSTLGRWATLGDAALADALTALDVRPTPDTLARARALFARVLDLPGGMRIGTIHAFSQSLLRRFPLEAAISPHFQLVDERDAEDARTEAREDMLAGVEADAALRDALRRIAALVRLESFGTLVQALTAARDRVQAASALGAELPAAMRRVLGVADDDEASVLRRAVTWPGEQALRRVAEQVAQAGSASIREKANRILYWLSLTADERTENWAGWREEFVRGVPPVPRGDGSFLNPKLANAQPDLLAAYQNEAARIIAVEDAMRAIRLAEVSAAFARLAIPVVDGYVERKARAGLLDYDDLIGRTQDLLREPGAAWVLYKLDGGLDHLLLDEVQDTSPAQWDIALRLTDEFFTGEGAHESRPEPNGMEPPPSRTVFAVGDPKQSIYSFQGADIRGFAAARARLTDRVRTAGRPWRDVRMNVSFRSTAPVLDLVDAVFADPVVAAGVVAPGDTLAHVSNRATQAGIVELWPLAPTPVPPPLDPWTVPERNHTQLSADRLLAETLAGWIKARTDGSEMLESRGRPLRPGDVMVLVRRRNSFASALVRALKTLGVPVAGLDRMVLTEQPAVRDLLALCEALLLPTDDLTFACVLTSPLGGLDDDDLMALAPGRTGSLWDTIRARADDNPRWRRVVDFFSTLLARVDYATPHALLSEALGPLGGRARLFARMGEEAAEPVAELLNAALTHATLHPPSLQGFLHWLNRAGAEVKREGEAAGNQVRIMTVHGSKGLQAPVVIVPDTTALPPDRSSLLWGTDPETGIAVPLLSPVKEFRCSALDGLRDAVRRDDIEEHNRLLYVALTRAEDRLLVCGWAGKQTLNDSCWYAAVSRGFSRLAAETAPFDGPWPGDMLRLRRDQAGPPRADAAVEAETAPAMLPAWIGSASDWRPAPPPAEPPRLLPLAPSRPEGVELGAVPAAASPLDQVEGTRDRFRFGQVVHTLLQYLPDLPAADRPAAAERFLRSGDAGIDATDVPRIVAEVTAILAHPDLAPVFGPSGRAEVPLTGVVRDRVVGGLVDRLAVLDDRVIVADFKTNRRPPARLADTPILYLRQMASYRAVLRAIFPTRPVVCALIWTRDARVSVLPDTLLDTVEADMLAPRADA